MKVKTLSFDDFEPLSDDEASLIIGGTNQTGTIIITGTPDGGTVIKTYNPDGTLAEKDYIYENETGVTIGLHPV